jgi:acyl-CoA reductase-like NAD-dependent aldehyde dehydrogenase
MNEAAPQPILRRNAPPCATQKPNCRKRIPIEVSKLLIDGKLVAGDQTMLVINPATEEVLSESPRGSRDQLNMAVAAAKATFPKWSKTDIGERRKLIGQIADVIDANAASLARTLTQEQGKPLPDATWEVNGMAAFFRYFATLDLPMKVLEDSGERKVELHRRPLGVVGAIIPWNYPLILLAFKMPPALLAGNTLVVKPVGDDAPGDAQACGFDRRHCAARRRQFRHRRERSRRCSDLSP